MINTKLIILFLGLFPLLTDCKHREVKDTNKTPESVRLDITQPGQTVYQLELKDSSKLTHIKGQFYRDRQGQLFERTFADRELEGRDSLVSVEYFNGKLASEIDPVTFEELDGWFAKDKNNIYYYRPTSGGMLSVKLDSADPKSFKILKGEYLYAVDQKHVFKEEEILKDIDPQKMKIIKGKDGKIIKFVSGKKVYSVE